MVERRDQADLIRVQHAVAEHVARHVADADHGERLVHHVGADLAEVPLDRLPGAARRDPELLVVVSGRPARGERVAEPEAVLGRDRVRRIRERRGPLVGRDHEVRVVLVGHDDGRRMHDRTVDEVVGEVEHAPDEGLVLAGPSAFSACGSSIVCLRTKPPFAPVAR
jgi:hypothetical protein